MDAQGLPVAEGLAAGAALVGLLAGVAPAVADEGRLGLEGLPALCAAVGPLARVKPLVLGTPDFKKGKSLRLLPTPQGLCTC